MDQLADVTGNLPIAVRFKKFIFYAPLTLNRYQDSRITSTPVPNETTTYDDQRVLRKPLLNGVKQIESIRELISFFSNVSVSSYESMYASGGNVDWEAVERGIMDDLFDGR